MSTVNVFHSREAIRVKVKKCEGLLAPEYRRFSVDPQITSFEVLQSLLARAFDIKGEFSISYLARDEEGKDTYLSLLSDWDLDAAFLGSSDPCLQLKVDLKPFEEGLEDWEVVAPLDANRSNNTSFTIDRSSITGTILNHVEKTFNMVQRALNLSESEHDYDSYKPVKQPMVDSEFHLYLDSEGRLIKPRELRLSVYQRGIDPSLRKVVWKHILNVYPHGLTAKERIAYMKQRSAEYQKLRQTWQDMISSGNLTDEIQYVTNMVRKDVLRTDRTHKFYAGSDDNKNVVSLFNILTTYALNHPSVSYCQGMSDLASPILVTMKDEAHAYVCFCALMQRLKPNFHLDGKAMTTNFQQLTELLEHYDSPFFEYLKTQNADDLLFCYRWLLLELKREFAFDEALSMLEVLWSSIPPSPPEKELSLFEELFSANSFRPQSPRIHSRENPYTKVRAIRKQNSASSIRGLMKSSSKETEEPEAEKLTGSQIDSPIPKENASGCSHKEKPVSISRRNSNSEITNDDSQDYLPMTTSMTRELRMELENLNRQLPGSFLQRSITIDSEDLDSPRSPDCCESTRESLRYCQHLQSIDQSVEDEALESWTSDDLSGMDQICRLGSTKKSHKHPEYLHLNGNDTVGDANYCCTPDEQFEIDFDVQLKSSSDIPCNGEILENEESEDTNGCACHLKSVIPIRLVHSPGIDNRFQRHGSDSSDSLSESCPGRIETDPEISPSNFQNAIFSSENATKVGSTQDEKLIRKKSGSSLLDSGVPNNSITNSCVEALEYSGKYQKSALPPPQELGGGNPFMLFLCLTLLLQHRDTIMKNRMDYNELAMHFDKMVRKHNVHRVLHQARAMFREYLQMSCQDQDSDPHV
ncbi:TBC1 domain family member 25-like [Uloborus diversus]|uniref:TBC1 domain family member 25-like n=1 Tax=Uloborus diversus TaxID=327109 RepID=UPI0024094BE7|nr:TBC1 domain family member 25-like [Uloborus diversus]